MDNINNPINGVRLPNKFCSITEQYHSPITGQITVQSMNTYSLINRQYNVQSMNTYSLINRQQFTI